MNKKYFATLSLLSLWSLSWIMVAVGLNVYRDKNLNYVPHNSAYLNNDINELNQLGIPPANKPKHVVHIGVDGLATYTFNNGFTPNMDYLMHHGAYTLTNAHNVLPTSSAANWASVMYATDPIKHGIVDQDLWNIKHTTTSQVKDGQVSVFQQIYQGLNYSLPDTAQSWFAMCGTAGETNTFYNWGPKSGPTIKQTFIDTKNSNFIPTNGDEETFQSIDQVLKKKPLYSFFYFVDPDTAGHSREWNSEEYNQAVSRTDKYIGGIIQGLKNQNMFDDTLIIINSDHGGLSQYHGHGSQAEEKIPVIMYGKSLPVHGLIPDKITIYDLPATITWLLEPITIKLSPIWDGQPILSPFFNMYNMYDRSEDV